MKNIYLEINSGYKLMTQEVTHRVHIDVAYDSLKGLANSASQQSPVYSLWRQLSVNNLGSTRPTNC